MVVRVFTLGATTNWETCYVYPGFGGWFTTSIRLQVICY
jgi:hypothetical protein